MLQAPERAPGEAADRPQDRRERIDLPRMRLCDWRDRVVAGDPGLQRLRQASRSTLSAGAAALLLIHVADWTHQPPTTAFIGIFVAMLGPMLVNDPSVGEQRITSVLLPIVAACSVSLGTVLAPYHRVSDLVFLAIIFGGVRVRQFGPRALSLGMVAFMSYFISLYFAAHLAQLPWLLLGIGVGGALAFLIRFVVLPDRPDAMLRHTVEAFRSEIRVLLRDLASSVEEGRWTPRHQRDYFDDLGRLNELAIAFEDQLDVPGAADAFPGISAPELRFRIFKLEMSAETAAEAVRSMLTSEGWDPSLAILVLPGLTSARDALWRKTLAPGSSLPEALQRVMDEELPPQSRAATSSLRRLVLALASLLETSAAGYRAPAGLFTTRDEAGSDGKGEDADKTAQAPVEEQDDPAALDPEDDGPQRFLRQAIQATLGGGLAMAAGQAVSQQRWFWAVLASFVVFNQSTTRGETVMRAWQRVLGTVGGVAGGMFLGRAVQGHEHLQIALVFLFIFIAYYLIRVNYAWTMAWITMMLAVLYSLLGRFTIGLLELRVIETFIGALIGVLASLLVLPLRTGRRVNSLVKDILLSSAGFLECAVTGDSVTEGDLLASARELDRKLKDLRKVSVPLRRTVLPLDRAERSSLVYAVLALVFYVRQLVPVLARRQAAREELQSVALQLASKARAAAALLQGETITKAPPVSPLLDRLSPLLDRFSPGLSDLSLEESRVLLIHGLRRVDELLEDILEAAPRMQT